MTGSDESRGSGFWNLIWIAVALIFCLAVGYYAWARIFVTRRLEHADGVELTQTLKRWVEAGRPEGQTLTEFMRGRRPDLVVSNRLFVIGQTNLVTQFALTNPYGRTGTLFVTSNEVLIWMDPSGKTELVSRNTNPQ